VKLIYKKKKPSCDWQGLWAAYVRYVIGSHVKNAAAFQLQYYGKSISMLDWLLYWISWQPSIWNGTEESTNTMTLPRTVECVRHPLLWFWKLVVRGIILETYYCMYMKQVLCNTVHYIYEVYKCVYMYEPAVEATALTVFTVWLKALNTGD
jgi:hypothetical protein